MQISTLTSSMALYISAKALQLFGRSSGFGVGIFLLDYIYALAPSVPAAPSVSQPRPNDWHLSGSALQIKKEARERVS